MAKIHVAGRAVVITSAFKLEELKLIQKYRPNALNLMGGENGKEVIFTVAVDKEDGSINEYGAVFNSESYDAAKLATLTMMMSNDVAADKLNDYIADAVGGAIINLNKLEATLGAVLTEIAAEKQAVIDSISIVGVAEQTDEQ